MVIGKEGKDCRELWVEKHLNLLNSHIIDSTELYYPFSFLKTHMCTRTHNELYNVFRVQTIGLALKVNLLKTHKVI